MIVNYTLKASYTLLHNKRVTETESMVDTCIWLKRREGTVEALVHRVWELRGSSTMPKSYANE